MPFNWVFMKGFSFWTNNASNVYDYGTLLFVGRNHNILFSHRYVNSAKCIATGWANLFISFEACDQISASLIIKYVCWFVDHHFCDLIVLLRVMLLIVYASIPSTIEGVSTKKHLTTILGKKSRFWHQASQRNNPDVLNHTNKGKSLTKTRKVCVFVNYEKLYIRCSPTYERLRVKGEIWMYFECIYYIIEEGLLCILFPLVLGIIKSRN